jgi:hypothetical protein
VRRPQRKLVVTVAVPQSPIRDGRPAHGVLAAQFSAPGPAFSDSSQRTVLYLALVLAAILGALLSLVATAPVLARHWPEVFIPVIQSSERIVLAGVCLATGALTLAITWALTGPGA